jgi:hypothetical protein
VLPTLSKIFLPAGLENQAEGEKKFSLLQLDFFVTFEQFKTTFKLIVVNKIQKKSEPKCPFSVQHEFYKFRTILFLGNFF